MAASPHEAHGALRDQSFQAVVQVTESTRAVAHKPPEEHRSPWTAGGNHEPARGAPMAIAHVDLRRMEVAVLAGMAINMP